MILLDGLGLTLAFLAPMPPTRPGPPNRPHGSAWAAALVMASLCLMMVLPMIAIWSFWGPHDPFRVRCESAGGHVIQSPSEGVRPYRCDQSAAAR